MTNSKLVRENRRLWSLACQLARAVVHYRGNNHYDYKSRALTRFNRFTKTRKAP